MSKEILNGNNITPNQLTEEVAANLIKKYLKKHPGVYQDLLPHVWIAWGTGTATELNITQWHSEKIYSKAIYLDTKTGIRKTEPEDWMVPLAVDEKYRKNPIGYDSKTHEPIYEDDDVAEWRKDMKNNFMIGSTYVGWDRNTKRSKFNYFYKKPSGVYTTAYFHYDDKLGVSAVGIATMNSNRTQQENTTRDWIIPGGLKFIIGKHKKLFNKNGRWINDASADCWMYGKYDESWKATASDFSKQITRTAPNKCFIEQFKKCVGNLIVLQGGKTEQVENMWQFDNWFRYHEPTSASNKQKEAVDKLTSVPLRDIMEIASENPVEKVNSNYGSEYIPGLYYFERIDGYDVIRYISRLNDGTGVTETFRAYVPDKGTKVICVRQTTFEGWIRCNQFSESWRNYSKIANINDIDHKMKRLRYIKDIIVGLCDKQKDNCRYAKNEVSLGCVIQVLRNPVIEKVSKSGYSELAVALTGDTIANNIRTYFGYYNESASTIHGSFGVSKDQLDWWYNNIFVRRRHVVYTSTSNGYGGYYTHDITYDDLACGKYLFSKIRTLFGFDTKEVLSDYDMGTFMEMVYCLDRWCGESRGYYSSRSVNLELPGITTVKEKRKVIHRLVKIFKKHDNQLNSLIYNPYNDAGKWIEKIQKTISDTINTYNRLPLTYRDRLPRFSWIGLEQISDWNRLHDIVVDLNTQAQAEQRARDEEVRKADAAKRAKIYEKTKKERLGLEYEDDNYIIRLPEDEDEISNEGFVLSHCVGGYAQRHIVGATTIMFLRRKKNPDDPWYTIEVSNGRISQIHGKSNCWLAYTEEGRKAIPFTMKWLHKNKIDCETHILTAKAAGYSSSGCEHIPLPVVEFDD
jgi:hypothetical protein